MPADFQTSTLWRISAFDELREQPQVPGLERQTMLSSTLQAELSALERRREESDALEVVAACVRLQEAALVYLRVDDLVWPITLFPSQMLYHSPRLLSEASAAGLASVSAIGVEPAALRPPGHYMSERVADLDAYRPLGPLLWQLALKGPRNRLLAEIGGTAAYRALRSPRSEDMALPGAIGPAVERLRRETVSLKQIAEFPGMSAERGARMLNALYLCSNLLVTRSHSGARSEPGLKLFGVRLR